MQILVNAGDNIQGGELLDSTVTSTLEEQLARFREQLTRVEVHMSDENADKGGLRDKRCMIEARQEGRPPIAVTEFAATMKQAFDGATEKLVRLLEKSMDKLQDHRKTAAPVPPPVEDAS